MDGDRHGMGVCGDGRGDYGGACGSADAHLNPAVTLGAAISTGQLFEIVAVRFGAISGRVCGSGAGVAALWAALERDGGSRGRSWRFSVRRGDSQRGPNNLLSEVIGTFVLIFVLGAIFSKSVAANGFMPGWSPYLVGCLVWAIGLSLGGTTGYAINPARDLGPRIAHAVLPIAGKGDSNWGYAAVPVIGPLLGRGWRGCWCGF